MDVHLKRGSGTPLVGQIVADVQGAVGRLRCSQLVKDAFWSMVLIALNTLLTFLATVLLARLLGAEGYGIYAYALSLVTLLAMPAHSGLPNLVVRETARGMARGRPDLVKGVWNWARRMVVVLSVSVVVVVGPFLVIWQGGLESPQGLTVAWALTLIPLMALGNLRGAALRGLQHIVAGQVPESFIRPGFFLILFGGIAFVDTDQLSASFAMFLYATASLTAFLVGAWLLWFHVPPEVRLTRKQEEGKGWLVSSALFALISGFNLINIQAATVILGIFKTLDQVGIYRVSVQVATLASLGLLAVNHVVASRFADLYERGEIKGLQRLVTLSARVVLAFNIVLTILFVLFGRFFFTLVFGTEFAASYLPLLILLIGQTVNSATGSVGFLLNMTSNERETVLGIALAACINLMISVLAIPIWGTLGAAAATAVSMVVWNLVLWCRVRKVLNINSFAFPISIGKQT